ncbi:MAG: hypothetical protein E7110_02645 [Bacteroidales bacterium]|nr:hypothetical protein [Bacteroidales bacterium]
MENREFDKIREKLYDMQMPVGADVWGDIQRSLRRRRVRRVLYYVSSSAAAILLALLFLFPADDAAVERSLVAQDVAVEESPVAPQVQEVPQVSVAVAQPVAVEKGAYATSPVQVAQTVGDAQAEVGAQVAQAVQQMQETEDILPAGAVQTVVTPEEAKAVEATEAKEAAEGTEDAKTKDVKVKEFILDDTFDVAGEPVKAPRKYALAFSQGIVPGSSASVDASWIRASSAFNGAMGHNHIVEQISDTRYSLPVNLGVQLQFPLGENVALGVGVNYSLLKSKYECLVDKVRHSVKQKLHYIGIPINVYGLVVDKNNFIFYINGGIAFEKGIRAVYDLKSYTGSQSYSADIDGVQFSVNAGLGVEYKFGNVVGLYFEPNLVYYTNSEVMYSIRTDQPFQVKADVGLRFHF